MVVNERNFWGIGTKAFGTGSVHDLYGQIRGLGGGIQCQSRLNVEVIADEEDKAGEKLASR